MLSGSQSLQHSRWRVVCSYFSKKRCAGERGVVFYFGARGGSGCEGWVQRSSDPARAGPLQQALLCAAQMSKCCSDRSSRRPHLELERRRRLREAAASGGGRRQRHASGRLGRARGRGKGRARWRARWMRSGATADGAALAGPLWRG